MAESLIELKDIYKIYHMGDEQVCANDGISLNINRGEFVAIVGKSGSGKSTLMNIIGALDVPTSGSYLLGGEDVDQMSDDQLADIRNRMIGFIFQQYNLLPKSNLLENVELPLLYAKIPAEERRERAMRSLERVGLAEKWKNMPNQLSGGQQQRVSIARALTGDPSLIENFLYEKFKNEDLYTVTAMSEMLDSLNSMIAMVSAGLGGIAGISLLVAGVGVMNIMLVSVTERTREIGIRKALGAKRSVIMQQFVIEAAVTSSLGGVIGILLGSIATSTIGALAGLNATPTPMAVIVSFSVSLGIGLLFGYMPASRAAKLNPIDALRSE